MLRARTLITVIMAGLLSFACVNTNVVILDESQKYAPSRSVQILERPPEQPYEVIAQLETRGAVGKTLPELLQNMREKAKEIGADAIIPTEEVREQLQQGIIYNPWLGGYQTIGGGQVPILKGYAIILESSKRDRRAAFRPVRTVGLGVGADVVAFALDGYGAGAWIGRKRVRMFGEIYSLQTPSVFLRDGLQDGEVEIGYKVDADYFFFDNLSGLFFSSGLEYTQSNVGAQGTTARGSYDAMWFSVGFGYLWRIGRFVYLDSRLHVNAMLVGDKEFLVGTTKYFADDAALSAYIGVGISY